MNNLRNFCRKFYDERGKHIGKKWLTISSFWKRVSYDFSKGERLNAFMTADIGFDEKFKALLQEDMKEGRITKEEIKSHIVLLKNHKSRAGGRGEYTTYLAAFYSVLISLISLFENDGKTKTIVALFTLFIFLAIAERSMLNDSKAATEELINLLESEVAEKKS